MKKEFNAAAIVDPEYFSGVKVLITSECKNRKCAEVLGKLNSTGVLSLSKTPAGDLYLFNNTKQ